MNFNFLEFTSKFFIKRWIIGFSRHSIDEIIRTRTFDPEIKWLPLNSHYKACADPFPFRSTDGRILIFYEEISIKENYGRISLMRIDEKFNQLENLVLLDTKMHLSYPFYFVEDGQIYIFPESKKSGKLSCFRFDHDTNTLRFVKDIINMPLVDSTIVKQNEKYWLFGALGSHETPYKLYIFYSDNLFGPYYPHPENPVKDSFNGSRPAGNFILIDDVLYRPSQNCENQYGESIMINRINDLTESTFSETPYMLIEIKKGDVRNKNIHKIHTINAFENFIVVDGERWIFAPLLRLKKFLNRNKGKKEYKKIY